MFATKHVVPKLLAATALAVGVSAFPFASPAQAINSVPCSASDYLQVQGHGTGLSGDTRFVRCFANRGKVSVELWVDCISTGNNDVRYFDKNGTTVSIPRWTNRCFPNRPPYVKQIEIL